MAFAWSKNPFADDRSSFSAGRFGVRLFLASLAMLFAATIIGFIVIRVQLGDRGEWPALPALPRWLWLSTALLALSSATVQGSVMAWRSSRLATARLAFAATFVLGAVFLVMQTASWLGWLASLGDRMTASEAQRFAYTAFYVLTGTHALHVLGGLVPMAWVLVRPLGPAVRYCAMYWHFLGAVWLGIYASLLLGM